MTSEKHPERPQLRWALLPLALADIYLIAVFAALLLGTYVGGPGGILYLLRDLLPWLLLGGAALLPIMALRRDWPRTAASAAALAAFLVVYGGLLLPPTPSPAVRAADGDDMTLRVMTYNVGIDLVDPDDLAALLREVDADIVALNEVGEPLADALNGSAGDGYPYRAVYGWHVMGKGLLSRYPILEESGPFRLNTGMTHLQATLDVEGMPLRVVIAHPPRPNFIGGRYYYHPGAAEDIVELVGMATAGGPAILLGDFNLTDRHPSYRVITEAGLTDSFREAGWGLGVTFPVWAGRAALPLPPLVRIDYVFHTAEFVVVNARVAADTGSDHLPLVVDLLWRR
ncbi:MAG: endonuclease/exonuclease/phosphatase family protein [Anaerolineae bacterium]